MATRAKGPTEAPKPARRTQAERRSATRGALLDATIECLIEDGYAKTTTTKIVERAGVSRGAQVHHFQTKAELVAEAVGYLAQRRIADLREDVENLPSGRNRTGQALDLLWRSHSGELFKAALELWVAARTEPELRASLVPIEQKLVESTYEVMADLFAGERGQRDLRPPLATALATIQGLALASTILGIDPDDMDKLWRPFRKQLVAVFEPGPAAAETPAASRRS